MAPGNNFGIGFIAAAVQENVIEENTIVGNTNGIRLVAGTERNVIRRNLVLGNPAVEMSIRNAPAVGYDILNLAAPDANAFEENWCLTALNAPCPAVERSFTAFPNPISVAAGATLGTTTLSWNVPGVESVEVRVGSPSGPLFSSGGSRGSAMTGPWVSEGLTFYLQDVTGGRALIASNTLGTVTVRLER